MTPITLPPKVEPVPMTPITLPPKSMTLDPRIHYEPVTVPYLYKHPDIPNITPPKHETIPPIQVEPFTRPTVEYEPVTIPSRLNEMPTRERRRLK